MGKKHRWRLFAIIMVLILSLAACTSQESSSNNKDEEAGQDQNSNVPVDPFGKYEKTVTINIGQEVDPSDTSLSEGDTPLDNQYTRDVKDSLNIEVKAVFTASPSNYDQKVSLAIASNDIPDAMVVGPVELRQMYEAGQLQDMTDAYNKFASDQLKEIVESTDGRALDSVTFNGKIMAIPNVQASADGIHNLWLRKDWLDKLGLEPPKTVDDLAKVAKAFVENDPDGNGKADTIGLAGPAVNNKLNANFLQSTNNLYGFDGIFSAYHAYPGYWIKNDNGEVVYGSLLPETKEALAKLRDMYQQGLIDKEMGVREDSGESIVSGKTGMFFGPFWMPYGPLTDAIKENPKANWQSYALPLDSNGDYTPHLSTPTSQYVVVRKGYKHPEAILKMENNLIKKESTYDIDKGGIGFYPLRLVYAPSDEMQVTAQALRDVLSGAKKPEDFYNMPAYKLLKHDVDTIKKVKKEPYDKMDIQYWDPAADYGVWTRAYSALVGTGPLVDTEVKGKYSLIYSQTKTMQSRWVNLKKLEDQTFLKIIMGAAPLSDFDKFVKDWKKQGGDQITKEVADVAK